MPIAVVSGADRNIGLEIVKQFLQRGWKVFAGRYLMELPLLEELQEKYSQQLTLVPLDVSDEESVDAAAKIVAEKADRVDLLVHNAAVFGGGRDENGEFDFSKFLLPYNVNALGAMRMVHAFLPLMQTGMKRLCFLGGRCGQRCAQRGSFQLLYVQDRAEHGAAADVQSVAAGGIFLPSVPPRLGALA